MLSRQDLTSPSRQDKNAGNSGDLVKHTVYLAVLNDFARAVPHLGRSVSDQRLVQRNVVIDQRRPGKFALHDRAAGQTHRGQPRRL